MRRKADRKAPCNRKRTEESPRGDRKNGHCGGFFDLRLPGKVWSRYKSFFLPCPSSLFEAGAVAWCVKKGSMVFGGRSKPVSIPFVFEVEVILLAVESGIRIFAGKGREEYGHRRGCRGSLQTGEASVCVYGLRRRQAQMSVWNSISSSDQTILSVCTRALLQKGQMRASARCSGAPQCGQEMPTIF